MKQSITVSKEDYLKAILEAESEGQHVISATLAHWLSVSPPAVTMALKRLKRDGYVEVKADGTVRLSPKGKETAYKWYEIHDEAERLEHAVSPAFEARLIEKLGEKGSCPHGNAVLPETPTQRRKRGLLQLSEAPEGDYTVASLYERDPKLLLFLHKAGFDPQAEVHVLAKNYDETISIETPNGKSTLGRPAAEKVWVKRKQAK
jgi:DtxR family transcriptional regulator, Mn-dependent transcriptional regulator